MNFYMPVRVYSEENCVMNHAAELAELGTRALIVTGKSSARRCGAFADVTAALDKYGVSWVEFAEVEENPSVETIMRARKVGCKVKADFVIGIGGGSPMDAAKAIALMMQHPDQGWEYMYDKGAETSTVPIAEIPTTAGTGSEVTAVSVLTRHDKHVKGSIPHKIFAELRGLPEHDERLLHGRYGDRTHCDFHAPRAQLQAHLQRPHGARESLRLLPGGVPERGGPGRRGAYSLPCGL